MDVDLERLDNGSGIQTTLESNSAVWHKSCLLRFSNMKLQRALNTQHVKDTPFLTTVHTRGPGQAKWFEPTCFFCEKPAGKTGLREALTFDIDLRVSSVHMHYKIVNFWQS